MFNVLYINQGQPVRYLEAWVESREEAQRHCDSFNERYPGKPYPNGKGFYPYSRAKVISQ